VVLVLSVFIWLTNPAAASVTWTSTVRCDTMAIEERLDPVDLVLV
jgi:hypothetical protein